MIGAIVAGGLSAPAAPTLVEYLIIAGGGGGGYNVGSGAGAGGYITGTSFQLPSSFTVTIG